VIAIIAILAAMLFPAIGVAKRKAAEASARADMQNIALAIGRYEADYNGRFPAAGIQTGTNDVTFGYIAGGTLNGVTAIATNSGVIAILMDLEYDKQTNAVKTVNFGHVLNPRRIANLNAKFSSDPTSGGVDALLEYRDPWGSPYVISMDTGLDDTCYDQLYSRTSVSQGGPYGLSNPSGALNRFGYTGKFMIWSLGADRKANPNQKAKEGDNKDNLLSWQ
ncbi:MAG TPA: hypothetical protein VFZ59_04325, partial [Verrucomicrobiae bacterium]|nr:hypothetical protein [Verrucomicrobiae bacterium]